MSISALQYADLKNPSLLLSSMWVEKAIATVCSTLGEGDKVCKGTSDVGNGNIWVVNARDRAEVPGVAKRLKQEITLAST